MIRCDDKLAKMDEPLQAERARDIIDGALMGGTDVWLSDIVLCELVWVLEASYKVGSKPIAEMLRRVSETFALKDPEQVNEAIRKYERGPADFADYLIGQQSHKAGALTTYSFDNALRKETHFTLLK